MKTVQELIEQGVSGITLNILVFGPQVKDISDHVRTRNLQLKRIQIRAALEELGHHVKYAEDLVDNELPQPFDNPLLQEIVIMKDYDLIVTLVDSPGSIVEATLIARTPNLALKSSLFLDQDFLEGLVGGTCRLAENMGADFNTYQYPNDLTECHLLGYVKKKVRIVQQVKYLS